MPLQSKYELPAAADFHVHLRDGAMAKAVVPTIRKGGVNTVLVMPNLVPPVTTVQQALDYHSRLQALDVSVRYLMTLYLHRAITPDVVREAHKAGIVGIKSYPQGVTTNSTEGVLSYEEFYPVFRAMEECDLALLLHGEAPSDSRQNITVLNAEARFLPTLKAIHREFPRLRIVLEHCTTADAVEAVQECGEKVVGTITAHHLFLTIDNATSDVFSYCKPVAKLPADRLALLRAAVASRGKFFLGTDSAPHPLSAKKGPGATPAGVFTQPHAVQYVLGALEEAIARADIPDDSVTQEQLEGFLGRYGRAFYGVPDTTGERIVLRNGGGGGVTVEAVEGDDGLQIIPFRCGQKTWTLDWL